MPKSREFTGHSYLIKEYEIFCIIPVLIFFCLIQKRIYWKCIYPLKPFLVPKKYNAVLYVLPIHILLDNIDTFNKLDTPCFVCRTEHKRLVFFNSLNDGCSPRRIFRPNMIIVTWLCMCLIVIPFSIEERKVLSLSWTTQFIRTLPF